MKAIAVAVVALSLGSCGTHESATTYRDAQYGWTIAYPASMTANDVHFIARDSWIGVVVANDPRIRLASDGVFFRRFPPDGAAFGLVQRGGGPFPDLSPPEARFPLSREGFQALEGPPPHALVHAMIANGEPWDVLVWFGPKTSSDDKEKIWRIVESIRFPPQRPGTTSGEFYVFGDASDYPVGSVAKFPGKQSADGYSLYVPAFYLVHAPGGLYAVGWPPKFERKCHMDFDRERSRFFCSTRRGLWDRMGKALQPPVAGMLPDDDLGLMQAKIGRDGQVLVGNWVDPREEKRFWPQATR